MRRARSALPSRALRHRSSENGARRRGGETRQLIGWQFVAGAKAASPGSFLEAVHPGVAREAAVITKTHTLVLRVVYQQHLARGVATRSGQGRALQADQHGQLTFSGPSFSLSRAVFFRSATPSVSWQRYSVPSLNHATSAGAGVGHPLACCPPSLPFLPHGPSFLLSHRGIPIHPTLIPAEDCAQGRLVSTLLS